MSLIDIRQELTDIFTGLDITTYTHLPARADMPSAIVLAGSPYVESTGLRFGEKLFRYEVWISAQQGDNQSETDQLDTLVDAAIDLIDAAADWDIESVAQPFSFEINNGTFYSIAITATTRRSN